ncbi:MAG: threonylcarbamoyl-AMP synthase [Clostridia bacterium]|nr:threonylcarbamoyl-AMP synthase [Clostridia bacterium]
MNTKILTASSEALEECGALLRQGELVCFPTETVYGLGANALDPEAVAKIFQVKNRPANNPLIAHISDWTMLEQVTEQMPADINELAERFWPGPLTVVVPRGPKIPDIVSAGLDTVAIRCPEHPIARKLIEKAAVPIVAPSANLSGRPSPTCIDHCREDLNGKVAAIIDGGRCAIGLESTVIAPMGARKLKLLRPGGITVPMLEDAGFTVEMDPAILAPVKEGQKVSSPGMLHRHYAPKAPMTIITGDAEAVCAAIQRNLTEETWVLSFDEYLDRFPRALSFGSEKDALSQSAALFEALRRFDSLPCKKIYAMYPDGEGVGLAVRNRLLRAASFQIIPAERL